VWPRRADLTRLAAVASTLAACARPTANADAASIADAGATPSVARADADADTSAPRVDASAAPRVDASAAAQLDPAAYLDGAVRAGKSIGNTSVVFKLELASGKKAAFKPASRRGPTRFKGEIAAYRLAEALGVPNVPPALPRSFGRAELDGALGGAATKAGQLLASEVLADGGRVHGAIIPWIDRLEMLPLEADPLWSSWRAWLRKDGDFSAGSGAPTGTLGLLDEAARRDLAAQISTLVAFDYLTGNWDRWSGANVGWDAERHRVLFLDNDGAFFETPPKEALAKNQRLVDGVDRYSRSFVARLRALDESTIARALDGGNTFAALPAKVALAVASRRAALLGAVDAKIAANGEPSTLVFP
jgi:hypothetical protein